MVYAIDDLLRIESDGRRRAVDRDSPPVDDVFFLENVSRASFEIADKMEEFGLDKEGNFGFWLAGAAEYAIPIASKCEKEKVPRGECIVAKMLNGEWVEPTGDYSLPFHGLKRADTYSMEVTGRRCTYLRGEIDPYPLSAFLNDLTACFHTLIDIYRNKIGTYRKEGKCAWREIV